jgi:ribosome biogenesis GTPase
MQGRVIANFGAAVAVETADEKIIGCHGRRKLDLIVCGDRVEWQPQAGNLDAGVIEERLPRTSTLSRPDKKGSPKPLAANFDQLLIVTAPLPEPDPYLTDAYLVYAEHIGTSPVIVFNKEDLAEINIDVHFEQLQQRYRQLGYPVVHSSCKIPDGLAGLKKQLVGHTSILVGQSGVGKSSIVKNLLPDRDIQTGVVSTATGLGMHTTTTTMLYHLEEGGDLIDSPGVREFPLTHLEPEAIRNGFIEFREQPPCRFNDCTHLREPGCAVLAAVEAGRIDKERWQNYKKMLGSV